MKIDALLSLAFSVQSNRGVYAVLLGSGASRAAGIPTGWEVVIDLIRKLAAADQEDCEPDPIGWYEAKFGDKPDYSRLLDALAKTAPERQQLLRRYFEPTEQERTEGLKQPTKAHRAIARLMSGGHIRVVLTTNFDRLLERSLDDEGIAPMVISTADQVEGATPLVHAGPCVIKLHGDYLDTRILNTPEELARYDGRTEALLARVFDEFGLIVCGWSAEWDTALRSAIERTPSRRYATYWVGRGALGDAANRLISHRNATPLIATDADSFFEDLETKVLAIEEASAPHPLSARSLGEAAKRFLPDPAARIRLCDLITNEAERVAAELRTTPYFDTSSAITTASVTAKVRKYDALCSGLVAISVQCGRWGDLGVAKELARAQIRLHATRGDSGNTFWLAFQKYPVALLAYAACLGAIVGRKLDVVSVLMGTELTRSGREPVLAVTVVPPAAMLDHFAWGNQLEGMGDRHAALSDWLAEYFWVQVGTLFASREEFNAHFDEVEILFALANHRLSPPVNMPDWHPPGAYGYRTRSRRQVVEKILKSMHDEGNGSPYVRARLFGATVGECEEALNAFTSFADKVSAQWDLFGLAG